MTYKHHQCMLNGKKSVVHCQGVKNAIESVKLSPNGKNHAEIAVKHLFPSTAPSIASTVGMHDGIGIVKFLRGKKFLITGATGFFAKVLIEKILRTTPDVDKIFVVIKAKNKQAALERLKNEIINAELFKCIQLTHGKSYEAFMLSKLVPVVGNVCEPNLGLEEDLAAVIAREVDVIVNSAANTTFDERYDVALDVNTKGPARLMRFAKKFKKLKLFLQVSTAYVNGQRQGRVMEKPFQMGDSIARESARRFVPALDIEGEMKVALDLQEAVEDNEVAKKMKALGLERARKYGWQDTYVFTKAMGEMMIDNLKGEIPLVIIRPSVIESTLQDPFPGWIEGNRMMDPIVLLYGKGQLSGFLVDPNGVLDVVPADMVVNSTLAAMAKHGATGKSGTNVYQIASSVKNPLVFGELSRLVYEHFNSSPCLDSKGRPIHVSYIKHFNSLEDFCSNVLRDVVHRFGLTAPANTNEKMSRRLEVISKKSVEHAKHLAGIYQPYTFYGGRFDNSNSQRLMECMSKEERMEFGFDLGSIDWKDYISNIHIPGLRRHVMKERVTRS
ncbi:hypothetical protein F0562_015793 [Nyssa sinensis]|uniref:Fatty acyl-CoA reductase n=1 Tax=Nyssa sinensis TaxID=561372 RepID=A0A5J4ZHX2_9ASTE|nr:hypothetical protein F0562_015793 [Nyssa sinensis]